jgi:hypothetical protein
VDDTGCAKKIILWIITADVAVSLVFSSWAFVVLVESFESFGVWFVTHVECHLIIICMQVHIGGWERQCSRAWLQVQLWVSSYNVSQTLLPFPACIGMDSRLFCSVLLALAWNPADLMFGKCFVEMLWFIYFFSFFHMLCWVAGHLMEKIEAENLLHRAFSVFLFNSKNELLLQVLKYYSIYLGCMLSCPWRQTDRQTNMMLVMIHILNWKVDDVTEAIGNKSDFPPCVDQCML